MERRVKSSGSWYDIRKKQCSRCSERADRSAIGVSGVELYCDACHEKYVKSKPLYGVCSLGKNRWYWAVWPEWEAWIGWSKETGDRDRTPLAQGFAPDRESAEQ